MRVSVVIPTLNEEQRVARAVRSAWQAGADEVVVVDGGSSDNTRDAARIGPALVVESEPGRAVQQNHGASLATGAVLLFLHADNWLSATAIAQVRETLAREGTLGGAFRQQIEAKGVRYRLLEQGNAWRSRWLGLPYGDQGIFLRRQIFEQLGGFPSVRLMEDLLLMRQLRRTAWPVLLSGPIHVDARRWQRYGVVGQTTRNWLLLAGHQLGASPDKLAAYYRHHDS